MAWNCDKCNITYSGVAHKSGVCARCRKEVAMVSADSLKTKDKIETKPAKLTSFDIKEPIPVQFQSEIRSWETLHKKNKNLKRVNGKLMAKKVFKGE